MQVGYGSSWLRQCGRGGRNSAGLSAGSGYGAGMPQPGVARLQARGHRPHRPAAGEPRGAGRRRSSGEADADVGDDRAVLADEYRVQVELGDLGDVLDHGADPVQQLGEGGHVQRRGLAVSVSSR